MRRTMALDTDRGGRRLGLSLENDHDGILNDKDVLPVYDSAGGPPKYLELDAQGNGSTGMESGGYEGVGAYGRAGAGTTLVPPGIGAEAASPSTTNYPHAPPGGPPPPNVNDSLPFAVDNSEPGMISLNSVMHSNSPIDSAPPPSLSARPDASSPPS